MYQNKTIPESEVKEVLTGDSHYTQNEKIQSVSTNVQMFSTYTFDKLYSTITDQILQIWILLGLSFVFLMNLGFIMIEIGTVSNKSVDMIIKKTILSFVVCSLTFYCFGYSFSN